MNPTEILVIDDEPEIRKLLEISLRNNGYKAILAANASEGMRLASSHPPDLIILDLGLPDQSGQEVLRHLREWYSKPIMILSVEKDEDNIILALDHHANDYLTKPFRSGELLARIRALLRTNAGGDEQGKLDFGELVLDLKNRLVTKKGQPLKLTATEYQLLALFARNEGCVLTHPFILKEIWGPAYAQQAQTLRVFIGQLRKKIEKDPNNPEYIITESRVGYRFLAPD